MSKKGYSRPGLFGGYTNYDEHGHKTGRSEPGLFGGYYHIVGWCVNSILKSKRIKVMAKKFDDEDFLYQLVSNFDDTFVIPLTCCDYTIPCSDMPENLKQQNVVCMILQSH